MEYLNKVEITGRVGSIRIREVSGLKHATISVATEHVVTNNEGGRYINIDWHCVNAFNGENIADLDTIKKSDIVHIVGRLKTQCYTDISGLERRITEIVASSITILKQ